MVAIQPAVPNPPKSECEHFEGSTSPDLGPTSDTHFGHWKEAPVVASSEVSLRTHGIMVTFRDGFFGSA